MTLSLTHYPERWATEEVAQPGERRGLQRLRCFSRRHRLPYQQDFSEIGLGELH
jgi:hypothetical protein